MRGRKEIHSVITPAEFLGEIRDRHYLNYCDSDPRQLRQLLCGGAPRALFRKCADVHFVDDLAFQPSGCRAWPLRIGPLELSWINDA